MSIGSKLDTLIKERGTNVNKLAQEVGVLPQYIYKLIERDSKRVDLVTLQLIAYALGVPLEYFADGDPKILTSDEAELLNHYRKADSNGRKIICTVAQMEAERIRSDLS